MPKLSVQVIKVAKRTRQKEVFANITKRSFDFAFRLGTIRFAGFGMESIVTSQVDEGTVIDDTLCLTFADDGRLHAVVKHFPRSSTNGFKSRDVATQDGRQVLMHDEARPNETAVPQYHREQPDDPRCRRLVGEDDMELGEIDLSLLAWGRLETNFEALARRRAHITEKVRHSGVAARVASLAQFSK